jgi:hypothetical protein
VRLPPLLLCVTACADVGRPDDAAPSETGTLGTSSSSTAAAASSTSSSSGDSGPLRACNGHPALCDRPLDQVTFATTHNSAASTAAGFTMFNANQTRDLGDQLEDGIRGMMLDVTEFEGESWLCHGPCGLGKIRHTEALIVLGEFLAAHPDEVLFIIYEDSTSAEAIAADWADVGLDSLLFVHDGGSWPTLASMLDAGTPVVVTAENASPPPAWLHHAWDLVWDTPYTFHDPAEFTCEANRGTPGSGLLLVNHWLSTAADLPDADAAATANTEAMLGGRAEACANAWDHRVNLLAVDFYDEGDLFAVVDAQNGV